MTTKKEINSCSFDKWYELFSKKPSKTLPAKYIKLPKEFIDYLYEDSIIIPNDLEKEIENKETKEKKEIEIKEVLMEELDNIKNENEKNKNKFPSVLKFIKNTIEEYEFIFPKLNWSAPKVKFI
jgi:hypothetical protein